MRVYYNITAGNAHVIQFAVKYFALFTAFGMPIQIKHSLLIEKLRLIQTSPECLSGLCWQLSDVVGTRQRALFYITERKPARVGPNSSRRRQ